METHAMKPWSSQHSFCADAGGGLELLLSQSVGGVALVLRHSRSALSFIVAKWRNLTDLLQQQHPIAVPHSNSANSLAWPRLSQRFVQAECVIVYTCSSGSSKIQTGVVQRLWTLDWLIYEIYESCGSHSCLLIFRFFILNYRKNRNTECWFT